MSIIMGLLNNALKTQFVMDNQMQICTMILVMTMPLVLKGGPVVLSTT